MGAGQRQRNNAILPTLVNMTPEIEAEKSVIALNLQQYLTNSLVAELATARVEIRQLKAKEAALEPKPATKKKA